VAKLDRSAIDDLAARVLESGVAPAAALAVTDPERTLLARTYGAASPEALWPVASIGKSFTAAVALQLVEEGLLDLHAPVSDYVPWLSVRTQGGPVTLHHLLTHTAGLVESSDLAPASTYDVVALAGTETGYAPGEHRHNSNIGYRAVGVILERATGRLYPELLQRRVLDRLGSRRPAQSWSTRPGCASREGTCRSTTTGPGSASTAWRPVRGWSPPRPTDAFAARRRTWPHTCGSCGAGASCCGPRAWPP
jgi:CubicO group peptidase (beta-lactamase class C family)